MDAASREALAFASPTETLVAREPPPAARAVIWLVGALFGSGLAVLGLLPVDRVAATRGQLVATAPTIVIQPLDAAILREVRVGSSQVVRAGELLARLDPTFAAADSATAEEQAAALEAEVARLEAEAQGTVFLPPASAQGRLQQAVHAQRQAEFTARDETFRQRASGLQAAIDRAGAELTHLRRQLGVATDIEAMRRELERGQIGSRLNLLFAQEARHEAARALAAVEGQLRQAERDLEAVRAERNAFLGQWRAQIVQDLSARRGTLAEAREKLEKARLRRDLVELHAPVDAVVQELGRVWPGAVLQPGEMLVSLVPLNVPLEVLAAIEARDMGFVSVGDRVQVKLDSYSYARHGTARGRVVSISRDAFQGEAGGPPRAPFYRARISLDDLSGLRDLPPGFRLLPGMPVAADIVVGERSILGYLFEGALGTVREGFREP